MFLCVYYDLCSGLQCVFSLSHPAAPRHTCPRGEWGWEVGRVRGVTIADVVRHIPVIVSVPVCKTYGN